MSNNIIPNSYKNPNDIFWIYDPTILFKNGNYYKIVPSPNMTTTQVLNSLTLFFVYLIILFFLFSVKNGCMYIPIIAIIIIIFLYLIQANNSSRTKIKETFHPDNVHTDKLHDQQYQMPSKNNPFMNVTLADLMDNTDRLVSNQKIDNDNNDDIEEIFEDPNDIYGRNYAQRQFYTMPTTTIPNDQTAFAKWLYETPETCKENPMNCLRYEDLRYSKHNPIIDKSGPVFDRIPPD
jgi:hypothetical protein